MKYNINLKNNLYSKLKEKSSMKFLNFHKILNQDLTIFRFSDIMMGQSYEVVPKIW